MRSRWRYWDGSFDAGFNLARSTVETTGLMVGFRARRSKSSTRLIFDGSYRYATEKKRNQPSNTLEDELRGRARGEQDFTPRAYVFASGDGEYDAVERLSIRTVPKAGLGYIVWEEHLDERRRDYFQVEAGGGWAYQKFFGGIENDYFTAAFGVLSEYYLPLGSKLDLRLDYLPAVDDWTNNYLIRGETSISMPIVYTVSFKTTLRDEYNSKPAVDAVANSLYLTFGLSIGF